MTWRRFLFTEPWTRIIGIPILGIAMISLHKVPPYDLQDYLVSIFMTFVIWQGDYMIIMALRKKYPSLEQTNRRIITSAAVIVVYNIVADASMCELLSGAGLKDYTNWGQEFLGKLAALFGATFIIATLYETGYFYGQWQKQSIETEQIKSQQLRSELSVLKNQVSPHFLFNSLNTLVALIDENQIQAAAFTEKLSEVYRYILKVKEKEVIDLKTELEFTEAYSHLMKMRFENGLDIEFNIDEKLNHKYILPLALQMLVENAIKHNVVSASRPLKIDIFVESGSSIIVRNNLQRKSVVENSMKTGLENIQNRYTLLSDRKVDIIKSDEYFMVALPLLELHKKVDIQIEP